MKQIILSILFLLFLVASVEATDRYASPSGSGSTCSQALPCTINTAIGNSVAGNADRVLMLSGTYNQNLCTISDTCPAGQNYPSGTSFSNALTIMAAPGNAVHIGGSIGINSGAKRYIIFQDLIIDYPQANADANNIEAMNVGGGEAPDGAGSGFIRFVNITSLNGEVTVSRGSIGGVEFIGGKYSTEHFYPSPNTRLNSFGVSVASPHCFYISAPNVLIQGVEITRCAQSGIQVYDDAGSNAPNNVRIVGNYIHDTGVASNPSANYPSFAITVDFGGSAKVYNNVIVRATNGIAFSSDNNLVYNNTFYANTDPTSACCFSTIYGSRGSGDQVINNLLIGNSLNNVDVSGVSGATTATNRTGDSASATFTNAGANNYSLKTGAPAINSGTTLGAPYNVDYAGISRPQGPQWDVGAYEFGGTLPPPVGPPTLTPNPPVGIIVGMAISVTVDDDDVNERTEDVGDWVGIFLPGALATSFVDWFYMNGTKINPSVPISDAIVNFTAPSTPGSYEFRFYQNGSNLEIDRLATVAFTVGSPGLVFKYNGSSIIKMAGTGQTVKVGVP